MLRTLKGCYIAYSVICLVLSLVVASCGARPHFELDKQPREVAPGGTIPIGLTALNPPQDARYVWFSDQGKCDPPETDSPWTKYTAPIDPGDYHVTLEVKSQGRTLFSDGLTVKVVGRRETSGASPSPQSTEEGSAASNKPVIRITEVPAYDPVGGPVALESIAGEVSGGESKTYRIVIYAFTDNWYVQPFIMAPFTDIEPDGRWATQSHLGSRYAALLVKPAYHPQNIVVSLPGVGGDVVAVATAPGRK
jgi:hypothetical protein